MKKLLTLTLALILTLSICACTPDDPDVPAVTTDGVSDTATEIAAETEAETETETTADTTDPDVTEPDVTGDTGIEGGSGGALLDYYADPLNPGILSPGINSFHRLFSEDPYEAMEMFDQWWSGKYKIPQNTYGIDKSTLTIPTLLHFIRDFNVSKETFMELNTIYRDGVVGSDKVGQIYTDKQVDALYADNVTEFYMEFKNPCAILLGDDLYTPAMLDGLSFEELKELGITADIIEEMMDVWGRALSYSSFYFDMMQICSENNIEFTANLAYEERAEQGIKPADLSVVTHWKYDDYALFFSDAGEEVE